jgi:hypothetical protein
MTIVYDAEDKRATHVESGLSVQFLRWGDLREGLSHFLLSWKGQSSEFEATFSSGYARMLAKHPELNSDAVSQKVKELNEIEYVTNKLFIESDTFTRDNNDFGNIFVGTWWVVVNNMHDHTEKKNVVFKPFCISTDNYWEFRG